MELKKKFYKIYNYESIAFLNFFNLISLLILKINIRTFSIILLIEFINE